MSNLVSMYMHQGRWNGAGKLQAHELKICLKVLDNDHSDTLLIVEILPTRFYKCALPFNNILQRGSEQSNPAAC